MHHNITKYLVTCALFLIPYSLFAQGNASLSLFPAIGNYPIGDTFIVSVNVDTDGTSINAVEGKISFNKDELEAVELSKDDSVLESWTVDPVYSNDDGTISFGGGMKSFTGDSGKIFSITFRALKNAESQVRFSTGAAILAADGQGTNILTVMNAGVYTLAAKEVIPAPELADTNDPTPLVLGASTSTEPAQKILITSLSHPDENKWYNQKAAQFTWTLPPEVTAVRLSATESSSSVPTKVYNPPVSEKTIQDVSDGVSYFHLQAKTSFGWGEPTVYRFQTDTKKPEAFHMVEASSTDTFGFLFESHDKTSGIEKYLVSIDGGAETEWRDDGSHKYIPPEGKPGTHTLSAKAVDFAGNFATSSVNFTLEPINPPAIIDFEHELTLGNALVVRGKADPNASVSVWVSKDGTRAVENKLASGSDGSFTFVLSGKAQEGTYKIYAEETGRGVRSVPSASVLIIVSQPKIVLFGNAATGYLSVLIPLVTLVLLLIFILVYGWHRFKIFRATLQKEVEEVEAVSRESFSALRKEITEDDRLLESAGTPEEKTQKRKAASDRLKKSMDVAEANVEKEISDVKAKMKKTVKVKINKVD